MLQVDIGAVFSSWAAHELLHVDLHVHPQSNYVYASGKSRQDVVVDSKRLRLPNQRFGIHFQKRVGIFDLYFHVVGEDLQVLTEQLLSRGKVAVLQGGFGLYEFLLS